MFNSAHEGWKWAFNEAGIGMIAFLLIFVPLYRMVYRSIRRWRLWQSPAEFYDRDAEPIADPRRHPLSLWECTVFALLFVCIGCWWQSIPMMRTMYYIEHADNWRSRKEGAHAIALYRRALDIDPQSGLAHWGLGQEYEVLGRQDAALHEYDIACRNSPDNPSIHKSYADLLLATGSQDSGIQEYYRCVSLDIQDYVSHNALANALVRADRPTEAIREYRRAIQFNPGYSEPHLNLASVLQLQGRFEEAIVEYNKVLMDREDDPQVHNNMGRLLYSMGKTGAAIKELKRAAEVAPAFPLPYYNLGKIMQETGNRQEAIATFDRFLNRAGNNSNYGVYVIDVRARLNLLHKPGMDFMHTKDHQVHLTAVPVT
jgi:tetratricopeptide (TPR) repeat protein